MVRRSRRKVFDTHVSIRGRKHRVVGYRRRHNGIVANVFRKNKKRRVRRRRR
jgi:hypothetical protein